MAQDRDKNSEYDAQLEAEESQENADEEEEDLPDAPLCPRCGWHNTRPSHTKTIFDSVFRTFALRPYRCRTCGNRFRVFRRAPNN